MTGSYLTSFHVERHRDGSYTVSAGNGAHHFDNADQAMAAYASLVRRIGRIEADKAAKP